MTTNAEILTKLDCQTELGEDINIRIDVYNRLTEKVIRCKDCKWSHGTNYGEYVVLFCEHSSMEKSDHAIDDDHFCGYGEKND